MRCLRAMSIKRGGKTNNETRKKSDKESKDATFKDESSKAFKMPHANNKLLDEVLEDELETPNVKCRKRDSKETDCNDHESEAEEEIFWDSLSHLEVNTETVKDQEPEIETDIFWDSPTEIEDFNEIVMSKKSETETYVSWANPLQLEEEHEKDENVNRDTSGTRG